ncbi:hypothetical protein [Argonema galeatum]|uniref:hypothetical protein n=1 Tax=Argonema galeatum TaxID=2942762 RepID=UPI0020124444|nr:hypothetical protein [Argonema galeatum]MCL1464358.1 hypothetical protein [Argonema galeatum A003/A1]
MIDIKSERICGRKSDRIPHPSKKAIALPIPKKSDRTLHPPKNRSHSPSLKKSDMPTARCANAFLIPQKNDMPTARYAIALLRKIEKRRSPFYSIKTKPRSDKD